MHNRIPRFTEATLSDVTDLPCDDEAKAKIVEAINSDEKHEKILEVCNELLGTCGAESLDVDGDSYHYDEGIRMCPTFSYCNTGDAYCATLLRDHEASAWMVACLADALTEYEEENELGNWTRYDDVPDHCPSCWAKSERFECKRFQFGPSGEMVSYAFVCHSCGHHCMTPDGWKPSE